MTSTAWGLPNSYWLTPAGCLATGGHKTHDKTCQTCAVCGASLISERTPA